MNSRRLPEVPGLDARYSRRVHAEDAEGVQRRWHVQDNGPVLAAAGTAVRGTLVCVHGNPTWSYLWRDVLAQAPPGWRVIAPDHLGMGFSETASTPRRLEQRVEDLDRLLRALEVTGPVVLLAHDWGGPIGLGWALRHRPDLAGVVLTNTAVHQPEGSPAPAAIRLAGTPGVLDVVCRRTPAFVRATTAISRPALPRAVRDGFAAPYTRARQRGGVADFVRDIPLTDQHPSMPALRTIQRDMSALATTPALLVWGPSDPVFSQRYLEDMIERLPHADVHRYEGASHLVLEDRPEAVGLIWTWIGRLAGPQTRAEQAQRQRSSDSSTASEPGPAADTPEEQGVPIVVDVRHPGRTAIVELRAGGREITFGALAQRVRDVACGLSAQGVRPGDRVAVLVRPGIDLTTVVYALWRLRAVVVIADAGLGLRRMGAALRGAGIDHVVGIGAGLRLAQLSRVPGSRIPFDADGIEAVIDAGAGAPLPPEQADPEADGAVLFTSGATGPPKGVVYNRRALAAQVGLLQRTFGFGPQHRFVAAFAPFALYGPALGMASAVPDMDVTAPHTLTASALAQAVERIEASAVFASPAALRNVVATAGSLNAAQHRSLQRPELVLSAGAPVPTALLRQVKTLLPAASTHTPYGMTEALPVATIDPTGLASVLTGSAGAAPSGVCVGVPVPGVQVRLDPLVPDGSQPGDGDAGIGEILIRGPHIKTRYDRLWGTQDASEDPPGWHRSGDVGCLDDGGRLWVQGRLAHVLWTAQGPVPPYGPEQRIEALPAVSAAAVVGVGPAGTQQAVAIVVPHGRVSMRGRWLPLAPAHVASRVRDAAGIPLAAVLVRDWLPVDIRHASKVDRAELAAWATRWLHGRSAAPRRRGGAPTTRSR